MLTDIIFWFIIYPFFTPKEYKLNFVSSRIQPFHLFGLFIHIYFSLVFMDALVYIVILDVLLRYVEHI